MAKISKAERDALRKQKSLGFLETMQSEPKSENNAIDKQLEAYAEAVTEDVNPSSDVNEDNHDTKSETLTNTASEITVQEQSEQIASTDFGTVSPETTQVEEPAPVKETITETVLPEKEVTEKEKEIKSKSTKKAASKTQKKDTKKTVPLEERYTGPMKMATLLLSQELYDFMYFKTIEENKPFKTLFKEIMANEIDNGEPVEDELIKSYRKPQKETIKKCVPMPDDLQTEIKQTAIKYHLKYTSFMSYALDKFRLAEKNK